MVVNQDFLQLFSNSEAQHLGRNELDHSLLHVIYKDNNEAFAKPFIFLNFWVTHPKFNETVRQNWEEMTEGNPFYIFQQKLKKLKKKSAYTVEQGDILDLLQKNCYPGRCG